jgi:hypothetical protein
VTAVCEVGVLVGGGDYRLLVTLTLTLRGGDGSDQIELTLALRQCCIDQMRMNLANPNPKTVLHW